MNSICIGIDFGTTNTLVSYIESNSSSPKLSRLGRGNDSIPTTIHVGGNGAFSFGDDADDFCEYDPSGYARAFKLELGGEKTLVSDDSGKEYTAVDLTREFIKFVRKKCGQDSLQDNYEINRAVITIPIRFSLARQSALKQAAQEAGFHEVVLIPEPEAAGRAYCSLFPDDAFRGSALIVDWGGGTLDLSLVQRTNDGFKVKKSYSQGDETMGGEVLDTIMWDHVADRLRAEVNVDLDQESSGKKWALRKRLRQAKEKLSLVNELTLNLPMSVGIQILQLRRKEWEEVIAEQLGKVVRMVDDILVRLNKEQQSAPDIILLVGGSCKTPRLKELLEARTSIPCKTWDKSMEAVALGAAFYAHELFPPSDPIDQENSGTPQTAEGSEEQGTTYPITISEIEAKLGVQKTLKFGNEVITVKIPAGLRDGQHISVPSQIQSGIVYRGQITLQNDPYLAQRAEQGDKEAQYLWGMSNLYGVSVVQNVIRGIQFIEMAARQKDPRAQFEMGRVLHEGYGCQCDFNKALYWFRESYAGGMTEAKQWIEACQRRLTPTPVSSSHKAMNVKINNNLVWAIITAFFCCLPASIYAIVCSCKVEGLVAQGRIEEALAMANKSKKWVKISVIVVGSFYALNFIILIIAATAH